MKAKIFILIGLLFLFASCGLVELDKTISSEGKIEKISICPPHSTTFLVPDAIKNALTSNLGNSIQKIFTEIVQDVNKEDTWPADNVTITKLELVQTKLPKSLDSSNTLGFISEMTIYISLKDGSKKIKLGDIKNGNSKATKLSFNVSKENIIEYISNGFELKIESALRDCPAEDITYNNNITAHIKL